MAKRRKKAKKHHRRRVSGFGGKGLIMDILSAGAGVTLGVLGGRLLNNTIGGSTNSAAGTVTVPIVPPAVLGAAETAGGAYVAIKAKHLFIKALGFGVAGNGGVYLLGSKGLGLLPASIGYGPDVMHRPARAMLQGFRDVPKIGNFPKPTAIGAQRDRRRMANQYAGVYG
jgi:hypothetical protein